MKNMINFTVGPVQSSEGVRKIGGNQVPYFRTTEFSEIMLENEKLIKKFSYTPENSKVAFITGSGTASMEAAISNTLTKKDRAIIVNGGSFGSRFAKLCDIYEIPYDEIKLNFGECLKKEHLDQIDGTKYTTFIVNVHETSTGVHYDMQLISEFCKENNLFLIADNISSFLADEFNMNDLKVDIMITGSQKALACPPGISILVLSERAVERVYNSDFKGMYLNLKDSLENMKRGQTPFTPAVGILLQINTRLKEIEVNGGVEGEIKRIKNLAEYFRENIKRLPLKNVSESNSNAVTALSPEKNNANEIFLKLKDEYGIWVCPNGGEMKDKVFRVGHIGYLTNHDYDILIEALNDLNKKGIL